MEFRAQFYVIVRENSERFSSHPLSLGFNASVCDEVLKGENFYSQEEAQTVIEEWLESYRTALFDTDHLHQKHRAIARTIMH